MGQPDSWPNESRLARPRGLAPLASDASVLMFGFEPEAEAAAAAWPAAARAAGRRRGREVRLMSWPASWPPAASSGACPATSGLRA